MKQPVGVERALGLLAARHRPVAELHRALLGDRGLELREAAGHLRGVVGVAHLDADGRCGRRLVGEPGPAERKVLEREPQRLRVREFPLEEVEAGLERGQLVVGQVERRQEVALGAERVQLLAGELVTLGLERDAEVAQFRPVGVEPARECLVRHLRIALDVALHVPRRQRPALGHQECHQRELADQLVGVVTQPCPSLSVRGWGAAVEI